MKVHIPVKLRSALLACFAVLSAPISTSIISGTISAGAVSYMLSQDEAQAEIFTYVGATSTDSNPYPNSVAQTDDLVFNITQGWLQKDNGAEIVAKTYIRHVLVGGISNAVVYRFNNAVSSIDSLVGYDDTGVTPEEPNGGFYFTANTSATNHTAFTLFFEGAMKDFHGNIVSTGSGLQLEFEDFSLGLSTQEDRNASASGTGEIKIGGRRVKYDMTGNVTVNNSRITVSNTIDGNAITADSGNALDPTLEFTWSGNYTVSSIVLADQYITNISATVNFVDAPDGVANPDEINFTSTVSQQFMGTTNFATSALVSGSTSITGIVNVQDGGSLTLAGTTTLATDGTLNAATGGTISITGRWQAAKTLALTGGGTLLFGTDAIIDLSGLTGVGGVYTVFSDTTSASFAGLDISNIAGVDTVGYDAVFNENGTVQLTLNTTIHEYTGGTIDWAATGTTFDAATGEFGAGEFVDFNGDSTVTLTSDVEAGRVLIAADTEVSIASDDTDSYTLNSGDIRVGGTLVLKGDVLAATAKLNSLSDEASGVVAFDIGAGNSLNYQERLTDFTGLVRVDSGELSYGAAAASTATVNYDLEVGAGATLRLTNFSFADSDNDPALTLAGGAADERATLISNNGSYYGLITATGVAEINTPYQLTLSGGIAGSGILHATGSTIYMHSSTTHTGTLDISATNFRYGNADNTTLTNNYERIIIRSGSTLRFQNGVTNFNTLQFDGGTFHVFDMGGAAGTYAAVARWDVTQDSSILQGWNSQFSVGELTGDASLSFGLSTEGGGQYMDLKLVEVKDYNGTLNFNNNDGRYELQIGTVNQSAGHEFIVSNLAEGVRSNAFVMRGEGNATFNTGLTAASMSLEQEGVFTVGAVTTSSFKQTGTGTSNLTSLAINNGGMLQMTYNGTLNITGALTLGANAVLNYDDSANLLNITAAQAASTAFTLTLLDIDRAVLAGEYDLGLDKNISRDTISVLGLTTDDFELDNTGDTWKITIASDVVFNLGSWDINWGTAEIVQAPTKIPTVNDVAADVYMQSVADYVDAAAGTTAGIFASTADGVTVSVFGGYNSGAAITTSTWIQITGGNYFIVGGASRADGGTNTFTGDTHILINQGASTDSVQYVVGGIQRDFGSPVFTGDSYISVYSDTVTRAIIGGNTSHHSASTTFNGDTNIYVYDVLSASVSGAIDGNQTPLNANVIIGSNARVSNVFDTADKSNHNGNSNVTIDLSGQTVAEAASFVKQVYGGAHTSGGLAMANIGDAFVKITGTENVTFSERIAGGGYSGSYSSGSDVTSHLSRTGNTYLEILAAGATFDSGHNVGIMGGDYVDSGANSKITGSTNITIHGENSVFNDRIVGAGELVSGTSEITGGSHTTINGGTFTGYIMAGSNQHNGTVTLGGTNLTITNGSFAGKVFGGSVHAGGTNTNTAGTVINISGGTFTNNLHGGSIDINNTVINSTAGLVEMNLTGGTFSTYITGGSSIGAAYTGSTTANGGVSITIDGADMNGNIIGGHIRTEGTTAATVGMGDVAINLVSGTIGMDVHAAGHLTTAFTGATTASTTVTVGSAVTFDGTNQVINGDFGGAAATSGIVTGDRKLVFGDDIAYTNVGAVSYRNFDTVEVTQAGGDVSISDVTDVTELTKTGAGTLSLGAQTDKTIHLHEGTLKFSATSSLTNLNMMGGTLDVSATQLTLIGGATVSGLASGLTMEYGHATGLGLDAAGTFAVEAGAKLTLNLTGLTLGGDIEQVLLSGATATSALTGVTYRELDNGAQGFDASDILSSLNGATDLAGYFIYHDVDADTMILTNVMSRDLYWNGGDGTWELTNNDWLKDDNAALETAFKQKDNVFFTADADQTITMESSVEVNNMTASGTNASYTFAGTETLTVNSALSLSNGADVTFADTISLTLTESDVSVGAGSILTINQAEAITMKSLSGAGAVFSSADVTITDLVTAGGSLATAGVVTLANGENVFTSLSAAAVAADHIKIGEGGISSFLGTQLEITTGGTVTITTLRDDLASFTNAGSFTTEGDLTVSSAITQGGTVSAAAVSLAGTSNSFTQLTATAVTQGADATLNLGGTSSMTSLSAGSLNVASGGSVNITTSENTTLASISGEGTLNVTGALTLTGREEMTIHKLNTYTLNTAGALNAGILGTDGLSLGGSLAVTEGTLDISRNSLSTISVNYSLASREAAITSTSFKTQNLRFDIDNNVLDSIGLTNGGTYILADIESIESLGALYLNSDTLDTHTNDPKTYTISQSGTDIILSLSISGNNWQGDESKLWSTAGNWASDVPSASLNALLLDADQREIRLDSNSEASTVRLEMTDETLGYTMTNGTLLTETLEVIAGGLTLQGGADLIINDRDDDNLGGNVVIGAKGALTIESSASLKADKLVLQDGGEITINEGGLLTIGLLEAAGLSITNTGELSLGDGSALASVSGATGFLATQVGAQVSIGSLENNNLNLADGSTLSVANAMTIASMDGTGTLSIGTGSDGLGLTVATDSSGIISGGLQADSLTLQSGSTAYFTQLAVNSITIEGELSTTERRLAARSLSDYAGTGGKIALDISEDTINALMTGSGGVAQSYYVYEQAGITWDDFAISQATKEAVNTHIIAEGNDLLLTKQGDTLTFTMQESTDRLWKTSDNFALTAGSEGADISVLKPIYDSTTGKMENYDILNTVDRVYVNEDFTIDLVGVDAVSILPDAPTVHIQNLAGDTGRTLTIIGDGATEDNVSLRNTATSYALNDLVAKNVTVYTQAFGLGVVLELNSITLEDSVLEVLPYRIRAAADAETGTTVGSLYNKEGDSSIVRGILSINGAGGVYTGSYDGATINALAGADQTLKAGAGLTLMGDAGHLFITDAAGAQMDGIDTTGADITIDMRNAPADQGLTLQDASSMSGGTLTILLNEDNVQAGLTQKVVSDTSNQLTLSADASLLLTLDDSVDLLQYTGGSSTDIGLIEISENLTVSGDQIALGETLSKYFANLSYDPTTGIISVDINTNYYVSKALTENGRTGFYVLSDMLVNANPQGNTGEYADLSAAMDSLDQLINSNPAGADKLAASIAGASTASIGMAASGDMSRQLRSMRNRTMNMGVDPGMDMEDELSFKGWISAEGDSNSLSGEGTAAGYDLSSWGGSIGAELDATSQLSLGLAFSSLYGSYSSNDMDAIEGDVNTNYVTFFTRAYSGRWSHTFVASVGMNDISTTRTVTHTGGSYDVDGSTSGMGYGALYEVAYTYAMGEDSSTAWQPLASIAFQSNQVDAYTESGSDAALSVGEQSVSYATIGLGARMETIIGENMYNRASTLSLRAMAKADLGDTSSSAAVGFARGTDRADVESTERGQFGLELGAGLQIPVMGDTSHIFMDASYEMRENQTNVNGTVGYRFSF